jgi:hypothetical protein
MLCLLPADVINWLDDFADNMGEDCPVFDNLFEFCQIYAGGTIGECISLYRRCRCLSVLGGVLYRDGAFLFDFFL